MAAFDIDVFLGEQPGVHPSKLAPGQALVARNVLLWTGALEPARELLPLRPTTTALAPRAIYRYSSDLWLEWEQAVDAVPTIIANDPYRRVYFTGDGPPRVAANSQISDGSGGPYPAASYQLGVPAPARPTATVEGAADDEDDLADSRFYRVTFVNSWGEEGPPSEASNKLEVRPGQSVRLTLPAAPAGAFNLTQMRIYRTSGEAYQFVAEVPISDGEYTDPYGSDVFEELPGISWDMPPEDLHSLTGVAGAFLAGLRGNEVLFSEVGLPHAWPVDYRRSLAYQAVAAAAFETTLVVATTGVPYLFTGSDPASMLQTETTCREACISKRGMLSLGYGVLYPSPNGLVLVDASGARLLEGVFERTAWEALNPASLQAVLWRGLYLAFFDRADGTSGAFVFNPRQPEAGVVFFDAPSVSAVFSDLGTGEVYLAAEGQIQQWDAGANRRLVYRAREAELAWPDTLGVVRVAADHYPVTVRVYADGVLQAEREVRGPQPVRLGGRRRARRYEVEVEADGAVSLLRLASSMQAVRGGG